MLQQRKQLLAGAEAMLFRSFARFSRIAALDGINDGSMIVHRLCWPRAHPEGKHPSAMRLIHDGVIHAYEALVFTALDEQFVKYLIGFRPSCQVILLSAPSIETLTSSSSRAIACRSCVGRSASSSAAAPSRAMMT